MVACTMVDSMVRTCTQDADLKLSQRMVGRGAGAKARAVPAHSRHGASRECWVLPP